MRNVFALSMVLLLALAACTGRVDESSSELPAVEAAEERDVTEVPTPTAIPEPSSTVEPEATDEPEPVAEEPEQEIEEDSESPSELEGEAVSEVDAFAAEILVEDDRPENLQLSTGFWNTDWTRHTIGYSELMSGGPPRDGIPSVDDPIFISQDEASEWLADNEPVVALEIDGDARAYPLQILTWHEIVNDTVGAVPVIVTFCPLCNAGLVFDRTLPNGQVSEFGVSGLLRNSDLVMYDRETESLWQQLTGEGIVGELAGEQLDFRSSSMVGFADFREAYPEGVVLSRETGHIRSYGRNPYAGYDTIGRNPFLFRGETDGRLEAMERVVSVTIDEVDVAYPFSLLAEVGVIHDVVNDQDVAVFHVSGATSALGAAFIAEAEDVGATGVFDPNLNGQRLNFVQQHGEIVDLETGSTWNVLGQATDGPLTGEQLTPVIHGNHFWFAWAAFKPETIIYQAD